MTDVAPDCCFITNAWVVLSILCQIQNNSLLSTEKGFISQGDDVGPKLLENYSQRHHPLSSPRVSYKEILLMQQYWPWQQKKCRYALCHEVSEHCPPLSPPSCGHFWPMGSGTGIYLICAMQRLQMSLGLTTSQCAKIFSKSLLLSSVLQACMQGESE